MGKYDNYSNIRRIKRTEKLVQKLKSKKKPDLYKIELAENALKNEMLFQNCQIFGREDFWKSTDNPNADIMFSDDNKVMMFYDKLIKYDDIKAYRFIEDIVKKSYTTTSTKKKDSFGRAIIGGTLAGGVGAIVGAASAGSNSKSKTTYYTSANGFLLQIFVDDIHYYQCSVPNSGIISNKMPKLWIELGTKLDKIISENNNDIKNN